MKRNVTGSNRSARCTNPAHYMYHHQYSHKTLSYFSHSDHDDGDDDDGYSDVYRALKMRRRRRRRKKKPVGFRGFRTNPYSIGRLLLMGQVK